MFLAKLCQEMSCVHFVVLTRWHAVSICFSMLRVTVLLRVLFLHPKVTVFLFVTSEYHVVKDTSRLKIL